MPGFANLREYALSGIEGREHSCSFRKVPSQATSAGQWCDLSMASGNPVPQYYAAEPLVRAALVGNKGIFHGADKAPEQKHLTDLSLMTQTAGLVGQYSLMDYVAYYPFVDMDAAGETQAMENTGSLPRYADGEGVMAMLVAQAPTTGGGAFTMDYTDSKGVARTTQSVLCGTASTPIASIVTSQPGTVGAQGPFIPLSGAAGGIRSVQSINFSVANGGLAALVLVKPLADLAIREVNTACERQMVRERVGAPRIYDGAYLGLIMQCAATVAAGVVVGHARFIWK
jgi:hypothetical protein